MKSIDYRGWIITFSENRPITGQWRAERFGVGLCNNSLESVKRMIDKKKEEEK